MFGLTSLGLIHTAIGLVALVAGAAALLRHGAISPRDGRAGQVYLGATLFTCLTGFGIFQHGGFGPPHALGLLTLLVLALAELAERRAPFGTASVYVSTVAYSLSFFLHFIPGTTETFTRLPQGAPLFTGPDDPALQKVVGTLFLVFVLGAGLQVRHLRAQRAPLRAMRSA
ncbi:MAG: hypothetical protein KBC73_15250 [Burkholderiaceae bacterium]|nr:hypothetical protein [Burkholderiaceae bacterium]